MILTNKMSAEKAPIFLCHNYYYCKNEIYYPTSELLNKLCFECYYHFDQKLNFQRILKKCECCRREQCFFIKMPSCPHFICLICFRQIHPSEAEVFKCRLASPVRQGDKLFSLCPICLVQTRPHWSLT